MAPEEPHVYSVPHLVAPKVSFLQIKAHVITVDMIPDRRVDVACKSSAVKDDGNPRAREVINCLP